MILVTGGTGFLGSHLLYHLVNSGAKVRAVRRKTSNIENVKTVFGYYTGEAGKFFDRIEWFTADLLDLPELKNAFKEVSQVYHCAALVSFDPKDYHRMRKNNITSTENIVNLCITENVKKLCFVSSVAALEKSPDNQPVTEENYWTNASGKSGYAITKHGAETEVWRAGQEGLDIVIVNPGVIIGSGFWKQGSSKIFDKIYNGLSFYTEGVTGFVDVTDVVKAMMLLMQSDIKDERFVLVSENVSFKDLFFKIADALQVKRPSKKATKQMLKLAWRLDWLKSKLTGSTPLLTKDSAEAAFRKTYFSSEKIEKRLGFQFTPIDESVKRISTDYLKST